MENNEKRSLITAAYTTIRDMILRFDMIPGQSVSDFAIAKILQMSRTPVREAVAMLRKDGLIDSTDGGHIVALINKEEIRDLYIAREAVECRAVALLVEENQITDEFIQQLRLNNEEIRKRTIDGHIHLTFGLDSSIHQMIVQKTGSRRLKEQMNSYELQNNRLRFLTLVSSGREKLVPDEHEAIIGALDQRSVKKAVEAVSWHLRYTTNEYVKAIERWPANEWIPIIKAIESGR